MELVTQCKLELVNNWYKFLHPELDGVASSPKMQLPVCVTDA